MSGESGGQQQAAAEVVHERIARAFWEATNGEGSHLSWFDRRVSDLYRDRYRRYADVVMPIVAEAARPGQELRERVTRLADATEPPPDVRPEDRWDRGYVAAHRELAARLRAALEDPR